jgi:hypothetical protein
MQACAKGHGSNHTVTILFFEPSGPLLVVCIKKKAAVVALETTEGEANETRVAFK